MIINPPTLKRVRFADVKYDPNKEFARMFALFQMISPTYWVFSTSKDSDSPQQTFEQSYLSQRLDVRYFRGQVWTNLEHKFDLRSPKGYSQMLPFDQLRKGLALDDSSNDRAVYSSSFSLAEDFDKNHPVYLSDGVWASYRAAAELGHPNYRLLSEEFWRSWTTWGKRSFIRTVDYE